MTSAANSRSSSSVLLGASHSGRTMWSVRKTPFSTLASCWLCPFSKMVQVCLCLLTLWSRRSSTSEPMV
ncbi:hypothetical protein DPMN_147811 [Dreissena polymorpha]|uniref:Uncharacterized protein n=1 Tax=Dreissena polymorpha TaxID=45954 RepID=A0A9D4FCT4_DREPO|nr:hypothetical protein DPMN_147811 [Dreissena polymorpha]